MNENPVPTLLQTGELIIPGYLITGQRPTWGDAIQGDFND